jgi:hypothetical protein
MILFISCCAPACCLRLRPSGSNQTLGTRQVMSQKGGERSSLHPISTALDPLILFVREGDWRHTERDPGRDRFYDCLRSRVKKTNAVTVGGRLRSRHPRPRG